MITEAQFLEQDAKILDIFKEEGIEKSLAASQENNAKAKDLDSEDLTIIITNTLGQQVYSISNSGDLSRNIDLSKLVKGIYMLEVNNSTRSIKKKIIIE